MESRQPRTLNIEAERKPDFDLLVRRLSVGERRVEGKDAFLLAMAYGFRSGQRQEIEKRLSYARIEQLVEVDRCMIVAVALESGIRADDLTMAAAYKIAEEYARAGIALLRDKLDEPLEFRNELMLEMLEAAPKALIEGAAAEEE